MLDIKFVRDNPETIQQRLATRGGEMAGLDELLSLDVQRREVLHRLEKLRAERNRASDEIAAAKKQKQDVPAERFAGLKQVSNDIKTLEEELKKFEAAQEALLMTIPNLPSDTTPVGASADDNPVVRVWGEKPQFAFEPKQHFDIGEQLGILDFERAVKITGARFSLYKGAGAQA